MEPRKSLTCKLLLYLLKNPHTAHTLTSIANDLGASRVGVWKTANKLKRHDLIKLQSIGEGKTNAVVAKINWESLLIGKLLAVYLTQEALERPKWLSHLSKTKESLGLLLMYEKTTEAKEIDIINISSHKRKFVKIQQAPPHLQKTEHEGVKINTFNFTESEFVQELVRKNTAFVNALKYGRVLLGQEKFVRLMKHIGN